MLYSPESIKGIAAGFSENRHVFLTLLRDVFDAPTRREVYSVFVFVKVKALAIEIGRFDIIHQHDDDIQNINDMM